MTAAAPEPKANMGRPVPRYDAAAKVTGRATYASDMPLDNPAYAFLVTSAIAKGRIDSFDLDDPVTHRSGRTLLAGAGERQHVADSRRVASVQGDDRHAVGAEQQDTSAAAFFDTPALPGCPTDELGNVFPHRESR